MHEEPVSTEQLDKFLDSTGSSEPGKSQPNMFTRAGSGTFKASGKILGATTDLVQGGIEGAGTFINKGAVSAANIMEGASVGAAAVAAGAGQGLGAATAGAGQGFGAFAGKSGEGTGEMVLGSGEAFREAAKGTAESYRIAARGSSEAYTEGVKAAGAATGQIVISSGNAAGRVITGTIQTVADIGSALKSIAQKTAQAREEQVKEQKKQQQEITDMLKGISGGKSVSKVKEDLRKGMASQKDATIKFLKSIKSSLNDLVCEKQSIVRRFLFDKKCNPVFSRSLNTHQQFLNSLITNCNINYDRSNTKLMGANKEEIGDIYKEHARLSEETMRSATERFKSFEQNVMDSLNRDESVVPPASPDAAVAGGTRKRKRSQTQQKRKSKQTQKQRKTKTKTKRKRRR